MAAGETAYLDFEDPRAVQEFWERYKELNALYWSNRALADALEYERYDKFVEQAERYLDSLPVIELKNKSKIGCTDF